jgi:ketosteroid isomerase-like protein
MDDKRDQAREFLELVMHDGDWAASLDEGMEPELRELNLRLIELLTSANLDGLMAMASPELVVTQPPELPGARTYKGRDGLLDAFIDWPSQWAETGIEPVRIWQAGPGVAITQNHQTVRAAETGIEFEADFWFVLHWRDGRIVRWTMHISEEDAERAVVVD